MDRICHPGDGGIVLNYRLRFGRRRFARVGKSADLSTYIINSGNVFRRRDRDQMLHPVLIGLADIVDLYAVGRGRRYGVDHLFHLGVCRMKIADIISEDALRARHVRPIFAAGVEVELLFGLGVRTNASEADHGRGGKTV